MANDLVWLEIENFLRLSIIGAILPWNKDYGFLLNITFDLNENV